MYGDKLIELGTNIGTVRRAARLVNAEVDELIKAIADEKLRMVPEGGWPGKNADERDVAAYRACVENKELGVLESLRSDAARKKTVLESDLELLEADRRGHEFAIRDALAYALGGYLDDETDKVLVMSADAMGAEKIGQKLAPAPQVDITKPEQVPEMVEGSLDSIGSMLAGMGLQ